MWFFFHAMLPFADVAGAFNGIAKMLAGFLGPILALVLVIAGYTYMFAMDDHQKASQSKRAIGAAIVGAIIVALALSLAPTIVSSIGH